MKLLAYSVYDLKALIFHPPFFMPTDGAALRAFTDTANDLNTSIGRHPADFVLFCVGEYDDQTGWFEGLTPRRHVADATALVTVQLQLDLTKGPL